MVQTGGKSFEEILDTGFFVGQLAVAKCEQNSREDETR
jgi:hypothetical protein